jgi:hypothetical protein
MPETKNALLGNVDAGRRRDRPYATAPSGHMAGAAVAMMVEALLASLEPRTDPECANLLSS